MKKKHVIVVIILALSIRRWLKKKRKLKLQKQVKVHSLQSKEEDLLLGQQVQWRFSTEKDPELLGHQVGRSTWKVEKSFSQRDFPFNRNLNPNSSDLVYRNQFEKDIETAEPRDYVSAALKGCKYYAQLQQKDGFWPGDYGGPMFLLPGLIISCYVTNIELGEFRRKEMLKYILNHQNKGDGGWPTHIEGISTVFGTSLNYVAVRLLGLSKISEEAARARMFLKLNGGATHAPSWAKLWMAILGVFSWKGVNPVPPELFILPRWFPFHPGRMWCHCRMVYLPMCVFYGLKFTYCNANSDPLIISLREEIFVQKYEDINWGSVRNDIACVDVYQKQSRIMKLANSLLYYIGEHVFNFLTPLRNYSIERTLDYIDAEDDHTNFIDIGPVNKVMNLVCVYYRHGAESVRFKQHVERLHDYLWLAEDGMKMQGYNGSQLWDTTFAMHSYYYTFKALKNQLREKDMFDQVFRGINHYLHMSQVKENVRDREEFHRAISLGGWPFSTADHGWPISDCTSEGLKSVLKLEEMGYASFSEERLENSIEVILSMHNSHNEKYNRGWASYEINRGYDWYEKLNPAEVFGDIMIDYCYVECTSACIQAILSFAEKYPKNKLCRKALAAVLDGLEFILHAQREDGSWYGSWAVCFMYANWFASAALSGFIQKIVLFKEFNVDILLTQCKQALEKTQQFILQNQEVDGGWSESVEACATKEYTRHIEGSQYIQTGWAMLSLMHCSEVLPQGLAVTQESLKKGANFLMREQLQNGDWKQQAIVGVFNKSCGITYTAYRNVFPIWALAKYSLVVGDL
eukprot:augustus_masked-scaffold_12-processed-gene-8.5-mRNA-1 protein AED:0.01 eAED:0.01 QI:0/-1/0/1/-1/1/1/0/801